MNSPKPPPATGAFVRLLAIPSALSLGALAAFLYSLKQVNPEVRIVVDAWSWIIFVISSSVAWILTRNLFRSAEAAADKKGKGPSEPFRISRLSGMFYLLFFLGIITVSAFIYALRNVSAAKRWDVIIGTGTAFFAIAVALYFFWRLVRFLEKHGHPPPDDQTQNPDDPSRH